MLPLWKAMTRTSKASLKNKAKHQQTSWQYWKVHSIHKDTAHKNIPKLYSSETTHPAWVLLANSALWLTRPKKKKKKNRESNDEAVVEAALIWEAICINQSQTDH